MKKRNLFTLICIIASAFTSPNAHGQCTPPNLVAWWNFDNGNVNEVLHNWAPNSGTMSSITQVTGRYGVTNGAIAFNGTSDYLDYGYQPSLDLSSWTISAIVYPTGFYTGACTGNAIVYRGDMYTASHYCLVYSENPWYIYNSYVDCSPYNSYGCNDNYSFESGGPGTALFPGGDWCDGCNANVYGYVNTSTWYCVTATYDGISNTMKLYVDGNLVVTETNAWNSTYSYPNPQDLFIGASDNPSGPYPYYFQGYIDDIKIYDGPVCNTSQSCNSEIVYANISSPTYFCTNGSNSITLTFTGTAGSTIDYTDGTYSYSITLPTSTTTTSTSTTATVTVSTTMPTTYTITSVTGPGSVTGICGTCSTTINPVTATACDALTTINNPDDAVYFTGTPSTGTTIIYTVYDQFGYPILNQAYPYIWSCDISDVLYSTGPGTIGTIHLPSGASAICVTKVIDMDCEFSVSDCCVRLGQPAPRFNNNTGVAYTEPENASISILPNPNKGAFNIQGAVSISSTEANIEIYDLLGKIILKDAAIVDNGKINKIVSIDNSIPNGTYLVKIITENTNQIMKIEINR